MKHIISLGAGVQSSTMALMAAKGEITPMPDAAIFSDTQWESAHVYKLLDFLETQLPFPVYRVTAGDLKEKVDTLPLYTTGPTGNQGMLNRSCTSRYKIEPLLKKVRQLVGLAKGERGGTVIRAVQWIGISMDECTRMKPSRKAYLEHRWPLVEERMTRQDCFKWMERNGYPKPGRSSCITCPYHSDLEWRDLKLNRPEEFESACETDRQIRTGEGLQGIDLTRADKFYLHSARIPLADIDFRTLEDMGQINMFENDCSGSCGV